VVDGKKHGRGKMHYIAGSRKGNIYDGEWSNNSRCGEGISTWDSGARYGKLFNFQNSAYCLVLSCLVELVSMWH